MLRTAIRAAREAGALLLDGSRAQIRVERLDRDDIKLAMDREAEARIIAIIRAAFPDHGILSEECGRVGGNADHLWVIDPLDGTFNFFNRIPIWCTSIGLVRGGEEILGVVFDPVRDELFCAERGKGAFLNDRPIRVSDTPAVEGATIAFDGLRSPFVSHTLSAAKSVATGATRLRLLGASALALAYVGCGRLDAFYQFGLSYWDIAAALAIITEAGGRTSKRGEAHGDMDVLASNGKLHAALLDQTGW